MKQRIKLSENTLRTFFAIVSCPNCHQKNTVTDMEIGDVHYCDCETPLVLRADNGLWYYIGGTVFD